MTGAEIRKLRLVAGWTQAQIAAFLGMGKRSYMRREQEKKAFSKAELLMLSLWWKQLRKRGLKVGVEHDPQHDQWWVCGEMAGKSWQALGPFEARQDALAEARQLEEP
jgi:transcriptional regulator with XRE-family HTH domain